MKKDTIMICLHNLYVQDMDDRRMDYILEEALEEVIPTRKEVILKFKNGITAKIASFYDDNYLYLSDLSLYEGEDSFNKLISGDRVKYYLEKVAKKSIDPRALLYV